MIFEHDRMGESPRFNLFAPMPDTPGNDGLSPSSCSRTLDRAASEVSTKSDDGKPVKRGRRSRPKVKTGCTNCKQRRIKCDEARPSCTQCVRGNKDCTGYPPPPRSMRSDHEIRIAPKPMEITTAPSLAPSRTTTIDSELIRTSVLSKEVSLLPRRAVRRGRQSTTTTTAMSAAEGPSLLPYQPSSGSSTMDADAVYFRIFQTQTASELSGFFDSVFYEERVLDACHTEPAIRHSAIALGALYKTLEKPPHLSHSAAGSSLEHDELMRHWQVAVRQYSEACNAMMAMGHLNENSLRTRLMGSVLLASFDSFIGDHKQAIVQIQSGLDLLDRIRSAQRLPAYGVATGTVEEELTIIFMRLAIQAKSYDLSFHFPEPYVVRFNSPAQHQARLQQFSRQQQDPHVQNQHDHLAPVDNDVSPASLCGPPSPTRPFTTVGEARLAHDRLNERMIRFHESLNIRPRQAPNVPMPQTWVLAIASFKDQLASWSHAFEHLLASRNAPDVRHRERLGIAALQMAHLTAIVINTIQFSSSEMVFDDYIEIFEKIVGMGLEIVREEETQGAAECHSQSAFCHHQRQLSPEYLAAGVFSACHIKPTFSMDLGIIAPLFVVATKCRQPALRRQAIELLMGCSRREGMWDSDLTARIGDWVMTLEEATPDTLDVLSGYGGSTTASPYEGLAHGSSSVYFPTAISGSHLSAQAIHAVPGDRRVTVKAVDFDLRARYATVTVGTRDVPEGMPDPRYRSTRITW